MDSIRTLERYLADYKKGGWDALKPKKRPKTNQSGIPPIVLQSAIDLRKERPEHSVEQLTHFLVYVQVIQFKFNVFQHVVYSSQSNGGMLAYNPSFANDYASGQGEMYEGVH